MLVKYFGGSCHRDHCFHGTRSVPSWSSPSYKTDFVRGVGVEKGAACFTGVEGLSPVLTLSQNLWLAVEALTPLWTRWQQGAPRGRVTGTRPSVVEGILGQSSPCPVVLFTGLALPSSPARPLTMPLQSSPPGTGEARRLEGFLAWRP